MSELKYVTFPVANLLKEKGFNLECRSYYRHDGVISFWEFVANANDNLLQKTFYSRPLQSDVVDWLLEKHGIWVSVDTNSTRKWLWRINQIELDSFIQNDDFNEDYFNSPKEAYESAFKYTLTELI